MVRLYFVAPHSNNKNNKGQHRTTVILLHCPLLSLVVRWGLIFIFHANYHELSINYLSAPIHDQLQALYVFIIISSLVQPCAKSRDVPLGRLQNLMCIKSNC